MNDASILQSVGNLPDWVNWLAQDADGTWWGYEVQPLQSHNGWYENEVGRYIKVSSGERNPHWESSLLPRTAITSRHQSRLT